MSPQKKRMQSVMFLSNSEFVQDSVVGNNNDMSGSGMQVTQTTPSSGPLPCLQDQLLFRKRFSNLLTNENILETEEHLICTFDCQVSGIQSTSTWSGKLFGTWRHLCFFGQPATSSSLSNTSAVRIIISWLDVLSITADKSSIKLVTLTKKYFFSQFSATSAINGTTASASTLKADYVCLKLKSLWDSSLLIHATVKPPTKDSNQLQVDTSPMAISPQNSSENIASPSAPKSDENLSISMFAETEDLSNTTDGDILKTRISMRSNDAIFEDRIGLQTLERRNNDSKIVMHEESHGKFGRTPSRLSDTLHRRRLLTPTASTSSLAFNSSEVNDIPSNPTKEKVSMNFSSENVMWTVFIGMVFVTMYMQRRLTNLELAVVSKASEYGLLVENFQKILETI